MQTNSQSRFKNFEIRVSVKWARCGAQWPPAHSIYRWNNQLVASWDFGHVFESLSHAWQIDCSTKTWETMECAINTEKKNDMTIRKWTNSNFLHNVFLIFSLSLPIFLCFATCSKWQIVAHSRSPEKRSQFSLVACQWNEMVDRLV